jgi:hypothetical protein
LSGKEDEIRRLGRRGKTGDCIDEPPLCIRNEITSPATKILVSHVGRMGDREPAFKARMIRPRSIYTDAAKSAGPRRMSSVCPIYGLSVQSGVSRALMNLHR